MLPSNDLWPTISVGCLQGFQTFTPNDLLSPQITIWFLYWLRFINIPSSLPKDVLFELYRFKAFKLWPFTYIFHGKQLSSNLPKFCCILSSYAHGFKPWELFVLWCKAYVYRYIASGLKACSLSERGTKALCIIIFETKDKKKKIHFQKRAWGKIEINRPGRQFFVYTVACICGGSCMACNLHYKSSGCPIQ